MALLNLSAQDRMLDYGCVDLLPELEEDVFFADTLVLDLEESFVLGIDGWWGDFISDFCL